MTAPRDLAGRFGSPLYVYELSDVDAALADLRGAIPEGSSLYYSLKANPHPAIVRTLHSGGCRAEISSVGELLASREAGVAGEDCLYTGPAKSRGEVREAVLAGVRLFSVESAQDFRTVAAVAADHGVTVDCLIRVNNARTAGSSALRMTGTASQFGCDIETLCDRPADFADRNGARVAGLHLFSMSNAKSLESLAEELAASVKAAAHLRQHLGLDLRIVDLGGGFAAPFAEAGDRPAYAALRPFLEAVLDEQLPGWRIGDPEIAFESGRYLAATCGRLVCTVADVKISRGRRFVVLDSGINHLGGLSGLGRLLPIRVEAFPDARASKGSAGRAADGDPGSEAGPATLVGPLCTPADTLCARSTLGPVEAGDVITIPNVGAYGLTASLLGFLGRAAPIEVVTRDGRVVEASQLQLRRTAIEVGAAMDNGEDDRDGR